MDNLYPFHDKINHSKQKQEYRYINFLPTINTVECHFDMITRKDYQYMDLCVSIANIFATCAKKQYGCLLVDELGHVVGFGYNGGPKGVRHCKDGGCPRYALNSDSGSNYDNCIATHAEANAFLHSDYNSKPVKLYVNGPPCYSCSKLIANSTIKDVFFLEDTGYSDWPRISNFLNSLGISTWKLDNASV